MLSWSLGFLGAAPVWALVELKRWSFSAFPWFSDWFVLSQVNTHHHLHSSSEDEDIESAFPNELTLQQVSWEHLRCSWETRCSRCLWSILAWSSFVSSAPSCVLSSFGLSQSSSMAWDPPGSSTGGVGGNPRALCEPALQGVRMRISHTSLGFYCFTVSMLSTDCFWDVSGHPKDVFFGIPSRPSPSTRSSR